MSTKLAIKMSVFSGMVVRKRHSILPTVSLFYRKCNSTSASRWRKEVKENEFVNNICLTLMQRSAWDSILEQNNLASELTPQLVVQVLLKTQTDAKASLNFFNWAEKQQGFKHNLESWCIIIHILASGGLLNPAQTLIRRIGSAKRASALFNTLLKTFKGCNSKPPVFDLLLKTYSRSRMIPEAKETFYRMKAYGFIPSTRACNEFLYALQKLNKTEMAWDFYSEMRRSGINPNEYTFSVIAQLICKEGKLVEAAKLLDEMKEKGCKPNVVTYNIVIDGHCKVGKVAKGLNLIGKMSEKGLIPDFSIDSSILNGLCTLRKIEEADRLFEEMLHKTSAPVNDATIQYCPTKKIEKAVGFAPDLVPYNAFINELCKLGKMDAAEMVFQKVLDKGLMLNNAICNAMIVGYSTEFSSQNAFCVSCRNLHCIVCSEPSQGFWWCPPVHVKEGRNELEQKCKIALGASFQEGQPFLRPKSA